MNNEQFVGSKVELNSFVRYNDAGPIDGIRLIVDEDNEYQAGNMNGYVLDVECPYGTQQMANNMLADIKGYTYKGFRASNAELSPTAELGDGITVGGIHSVLAYRSIEFGPGHMAEIAAPGDSELEHEYPYISSTQREFKKQARQWSWIKKTTEEIQLGIENIDGRLSSITQTIDNISIKVKGKLGETAYIEISSGGDKSGELDLSGVREAFANDNSTITIGAGRVIFDTGVLSADGATITGSTFISENAPYKVEISNAISKFYYNGIKIGQIGSNYWPGTNYRGIVFDLDWEGDYMAWAAKVIPNDDSYQIKLLYANKDSYSDNLASGYYLGGMLYFEAPVQARDELRVGRDPSKPSGVIRYATPSTLDGLGGMIFDGYDALWFRANYIFGINAASLSLGTTPIVSDSDLRLKTNVKETNVNALDIINKIKLYSFDWALSGEHREIGFISQQLEAEVSENFIQHLEEDDTYRVKETSFIPYIIKAIQELYDLIQGPRPVSLMRIGSGWTPDMYTREETKKFLEKVIKEEENLNTFIPPETISLK